MNFLLQMIFTVFLIFMINHPLLMADTKEFCADKWPKNTKKQEACQNRQAKAHNALFAIAEKEGLIKNGTLSAGSIGSKKETIIHNCMGKWRIDPFKTYDYKMIVECIKEEVEKGHNVSNDKTIGIEGFCANKWPDDDEKSKECRNQQIEARQELYQIAEKEELVKYGRILTSPHGSDKEKKIHHCIAKWRINDLKTYDYQMTVFCIKN